MRLADATQFNRGRISGLQQTNVLLPIMRWHHDGVGSPANPALIKLALSIGRAHKKPRAFQRFARGLSGHIPTNKIRSGGLLPLPAPAKQTRNRVNRSSQVCQKTIAVWCKSCIRVSAG